MAKGLKLEIEDATIIWRNLSGKGSQFNREGNRNFHVIIPDEETANELREDGWNVKERVSKQDTQDVFYHLEVTARFDNFPPDVFAIAGRKKTRLTEETVGMLDSADIESVDIIISGSRYEVSGRSGVKAYLKTMSAVINVDKFANKYDFDDEEIPFN